MDSLDQTIDLGNGLWTVPFEDVELVILDFDGVIADSENISLGTLQNTLANYGLDMPLNEVRRLFLGRSLSAICRYVSRNNPKKTSNGFGEMWQEKLFAGFKRELRPISGIVDLLDELTDNGLRYCIASSGTFERIRVALGVMASADRFPHVYSTELVTRGKPSPDLFLLAAEKTGVNPKKCLVIEDSPYGIHAAVAAEMKSIGFIGGAHLMNLMNEHEGILRSAGANHVVGKFEDLLPPKRALRSVADR